MKHQNIFLSVFLLLLFFGCTSNKKKVIDNSEIITFSSEIESELVDTVCFNACKMIFLETNDNSLFGRITRMYIDDNKIFILDARLKKIIIFDIDGKYLTSIHKVGNGPSEYVSLKDFCLDTEQKQLLLLSEYKILKFNYEGEFIEEKAIDETFFDIILNSGLIYCTKLEVCTTNEDNYGLSCMNMDMNQVRGFLPMRENITTFNVAAGQSLTSTLHDYYTRRFDNTIYHINNGEVKKKYTFDFKKHAFSKDLLNTEINEEVVKMVSEKKQIFWISEVSESENYLMFKTNIALFIFNKKTQTLGAYNGIINSNLQVGTNYYYSIGNNSRMIASILPPSYIIDSNERRKKIERYPNLEAFEALQKVAERVNEEDNPVLLLYEFK